MKKVEIFSAIIGDAALPLLGFMFWDWGFYFIVLYFLFDIFIRALFLIKRVKLLPAIDLNYRFSLLGIFLTIIEICLLHFLVYFSLSPVSLFQELWLFLSYEELGIAQGIVLLPLLFLNEIIKIRNEIKMKSPQNLRYEILKSSQHFQFYRMIIWSILLLCTNFITFPESLLVALLIGTLCIQPFYVFRNIS
ncbi:MAG: hypothetical protein P8M87_02160 [Crocinitomicaceae bacterium]|nr:hypothetical protein [Crocinitomicaceae bacterium]